MIARQYWRIFQNYSHHIILQCEVTSGCQVRYHLLHNVLLRLVPNHSILEQRYYPNSFACFGSGKWHWIDAITDKLLIPLVGLLTRQDHLMYAIVLLMISRMIVNHINVWSWNHAKSQLTPDLVVVLLLLLLCLVLILKLMK